MSDKKKQLLNESTVRRFMGLAGIGALSNSFVKLNEEEFDLDDMDVDSDVDVVQEQEDELPPMPGEMDPPGLDAEMPPEEEMPEEEGTEDVDLTHDEAQTLISLGKKLEGELDGEEEEMLPPDEAMAMGPPPEEVMGPPPAAMAEALVRTLTERVSGRIKKEYVVNEVMKRVAKRLQNAPKKK